MTIDFGCQKCDASFEIDAGEIIDGSAEIRCPNCKAKLTQAAADDFSGALGELCKQIASLSARFSVSLSLETDDLPAQFETAVDEDEDEEESADEDEDEDESDEELDEDELGGEMEEDDEDAW